MARHAQALQVGGDVFAAIFKRPNMVDLKIGRQQNGARATFIFLPIRQFYPHGAAEFAFWDFFDELCQVMFEGIDFRMCSITVVQKPTNEKHSRLA